MRNVFLIDVDQNAHVYLACTERFDWFGRYEDSTRSHPIGPLSLGEVVVQDLASGQIYPGVEGFRLLSQHIPAYE